MSCPFKRIDEDANSAQEGQNDTQYFGWNYIDYLQIDKITNLQRLSSEVDSDPAHDEHLFIVIHQIYELWFKQILHEIDSIREFFSDDLERDMFKVINRMQRINLILKICSDQIAILETMMPLDYVDFRHLLGDGSGFESYQFRMIENKIGIKSDQRVRYNQQHYLEKLKKRKEYFARVVASEEEPSLLQLVEKWLERTPGLEVDGFNFWNKYKKAVDEIVVSMLAKAEAESDEKLRQRAKLNVKQRMEHFDSIFDEGIHNSLVARGERRISHKALQGALMITFYRDEPRFSQPQQLLTLLTEMDSLLVKWRYNHILMVHRMIGPLLGKPGGTSGYQYLRSTMSDRFKVFLDLYNLTSYLIPRKFMPHLTRDMIDRVGFSKGFDQTPQENVPKEEFLKQNKTSSSQSSSQESSTIDVAQQSE